MSDSVSPLSSSLSLDTTDFKAAVVSANRELRVLESGFRANAAQLGDWSKSSEGLELRMRALTEQIGVQQRKVGALQGEYERVAAEKGKDSRAAQDLEIKLNQANEALGKMQRELGETEGSLQTMGNESEQTSKDVNKLDNEQKQAEKSTKNLGGAAKVAGAAIAAIAAAALATVVALTGLVTKAIDSASQLVDLGNKTGISTTQLQEMQYVGGQLGVDLETMTGSLTKLTRNMATAAEGGKNQAEAFAALGIEVTDSNGELRDARVVYQEALTKLGQLENETERDALAMDLFGKSAMELNPLIKAGADEIAGLTAEAHEVGAVLSADTVGGLEAVGDQIESLKAGFEGTMGSLAGSMLPLLEELVGGAKGYMGELAQIVSGSNGDLSRAGPQLGALIGRLVNEVLQRLPEMIQAGLGLIQALVTTIVAQIPTVVSALAALIPLFLQFGIDVLLALINGITQALPGLIAQVAELIPTIAALLIENLPLILQAAVEIVLALVTGLVEAIPTLIEAVPELVTSIVETVIENLPLILSAALEIILALVLGLVENIPTLIAAVPKLIAGVVKVFAETDWPKIGGDIVNGLRSGFEKLWEDFKASVTEKWNNLVGGVKSLLGIQSPSTVFAEMGGNMALGVGAGFAASWGAVQRQIAGSVGALEPAVAGGWAGASSAATRAGVNPATTAITVNLTGMQVASEMDVLRLAQRIVRVIETRR